MLEVKFTATMRRSMKRLQKQGKDLSKLQSILLLLADGQSLPSKYGDHALTGNKRLLRECHIAPDWLLIYQIRQSELILLAVDTGSHADLFGM